MKPLNCDSMNDLIWLNMQPLLLLHESFTTKLIHVTWIQFQRTDKNTICNSKKKKERGREQNKIDDEKNLLKYTIKRMYMANKGSLASKHNIMISNYTFFHNFTTAIIVVKLR